MSQTFPEFLEHVAETRPLSGSYFGPCVSMRWDAWRVIRLVNVELDRLKLSPPRSVLDVGCGIGVYERELSLRWPSATVLGCDFSEKNIQAARDYEPSASFLRSDAEALPLRNASVDLALAIEVMEHFLHPENVAAELARVVRPGGLLIVVVPLAPPIPFVRTVSRIATHFIGSQVIVEGEFKEHMRIYNCQTLKRAFAHGWKVRRFIKFNLMTFVMAAMEKIFPVWARRSAENRQRFLDALDVSCGHVLYAKGLLILEREGLP
ncbi:MAG: class I SAM-dependent methyltransferase [Candidatus Omnitrophota bacterium]